MGGSISIEREVYFSYKVDISYPYRLASLTPTLLLYRSLTYSTLNIVLPLRTEAILVSASIISIYSVSRYLESLCLLN